MRLKLTRYPGTGHAVVGAALFLHGAMISLMCVTSLIWPLICLGTSVQAAIPRMLFIAGLLSAFGLLLILVLSRARRGVLYDRPSGWLWIVYLALSALVAVAARGFFADIMHDIALVFGSHGRSGCYFGPTFGGTYWVNDRSLTWLLFVVPPMLAGGGGLLLRMVRHPTRASRDRASANAE